MPILNIHLVEGMHTVPQQQQLLLEASQFYADALRSPINRVRAFITIHAPELWVTGGVPASVSRQSAPFFTAIVLEGRPKEERQRLLAGVTEIIVNVLKVDVALVRGCVTRIDPDDWAIGGVPASILRKTEVDARAAAAVSVEKSGN